MRIGLPKAFLYHRYQTLWTVFFTALGCEVVTSGDTSRKTLDDGVRYSADENCLPLKVYLGHVHELIGRCDAILVPRMVNCGRDDVFCVRFFGLYDFVRNTFPDAALLSYDLDVQKRRSELMGFLKMGLALGGRPDHVLSAYRKAVRAQQKAERTEQAMQRRAADAETPKILLAAQPYVAHDPYLGGTLARIIEKQGGTPLYSDRYDKKICRQRAGELSTDLYWTLNKEILGAVASQKEQVDGIIFVAAFPCASDALVNELAGRRIKDKPVMQIIMDEQQAEAGLETRIESFMDLLRQRRRADG